MNHKRFLIFNLNKFEKTLLVPFIISCLIAFGVTVLCIVYYVQTLANKPQILARYSDYTLTAYFVFILLDVTVLLLFLVFYFCYLAKNITGPYNRIIRDLDEIISGKSRKPLYTREKDEMFSELTKRINTLIKRLN